MNHGLLSMDPDGALSMDLLDSALHDERMDLDDDFHNKRDHHVCLL